MSISRAEEKCTLGREETRQQSGIKTNIAPPYGSFIRTTDSAAGKGYVAASYIVRKPDKVIGTRLDHIGFGPTISAGTAVVKWRLQ